MDLDATIKYVGLQSLTTLDYVPLTLAVPKSVAISISKQIRQNEQEKGSRSSKIWNCHQFLASQMAVQLCISGSTNAAEAGNSWGSILL
jgi:hypothetical protein